MKKAFSLVELAVVFVILGFISVGILRVLPNIEQQREMVEEGRELRNMLRDVVLRAKMGNAFVAPDNVSANFLAHSSIVDDFGRYWGYLPTFDVAQDNTSCGIDPAQKITVNFCKSGVNRANCNRTTANSNLETKIEDVAFVMFSNDPEFRGRVTIQKSDGNTFSSLSDYQNYKGAINVNVVYGKKATIIEYTYDEVWNMLRCAKPNTVTDGNLFSIRAADTTDFYNYMDWPNYPDAIAETYYDYVELPLNFLGIPNVEYCFEKNFNTRDLDLFRGYRFDETQPPRISGGNLVYNYCGNGIDGGGGNNRNNCTAQWTCNTDQRQNNYIFSSKSCTKTPRLDDACVSLGTDAATANNNSCWYKDSSTMKYMFCPTGNKSGNTNWKDRGTGAWSDIRVMPGWRGSCASGDNMQYCYRLNNRVISVYAKLPGSQRLYKQNIAISMRAIESFWKGDDPYYWYGGDDLTAGGDSGNGDGYPYTWGDEFWKWQYTTGALEVAPTAVIDARKSESTYYEWWWGW